MNSTWLVALAAIAVAVVAALLLTPGGAASGGDAVSAGGDQQSAAVSGAAATSDLTGVEPGAVPAEGEEVEGPFATDGVIVAGEYAHFVDADGFQVHWSNDSEVLRVAMVSPGLGYAAIGFDPENRMQGANIILGAVTDGQTTWRDDYGTGTMSHTADVTRGGTDDVIEAAGRERNGYTIFEFVIPLDSGDPMDKPLLPGETYKILVAYQATSDNFNLKHTRGGTGDIRLDPAP
jgi:hypothetical protein